MIKKLIITGLFLGGGYYFIKKILPNFTKKEFQADTMSIEERLAEEERKAREIGEKVRKTLISKFGTDDPNKLKDIKTYMFAPNINFDNWTPEQIESMKNTLKNNTMFPNGLTYDPNNLSSFEGLKGWTPSMYGI
tara:strand:+ start:300 stop:704 length:405 start_codon:yes stop_codon:yes gene_type:complete